MPELRANATRPVRASSMMPNVVNVLPDSLIVQVTGAQEKLEAFTELMKTFGIIELARTGRVALARNSGTTEDWKQDK